MTSLRAKARHFALLTLTFASALVVADSWAPPRIEVTASANGQTRVTVVPRSIDSNLRYFEDKTKHREPAGQRAGDGQVSPLARVERLGPGGKWHMLWQKPLVNDVAPTSVLLANGGSFLVTFDNWHSAGYGEDVVVIYDRHGNVVRKLSLEQILPPVYLRFLPRTVSSRWWSGEHRLVQGDTLVELQVVEPGPVPRDRPSYTSVRIRLADGAVLPSSGPAWTRAMAEALRLEAERQAAWRRMQGGRRGTAVPPEHWLPMPGKR